MAWDYYDAEEQKDRVRMQIFKRTKAGERFECLSAPQGSKKLVRTFWGASWCKHLETHSDYEHRLPRGRSYLRQGNVYNLTIDAGRVSAIVAGSQLYKVSVTIQPLAKPAWGELKAKCAGQVASLLDLLSGRLGDGVLRAITDPEEGLFPKSREIRFSCTCPDHADMCKHVAAALYGVGVQLDAKPDLFFVLRSVDPSELLASAANETLAQAQGSDAALQGEDLSALFGIELGAAEIPTEKPAKSPPKTPRAAKTAPKSKKTAPSKRKKRAAS
jgi:uncharacterized Zn finger protein